MAYVIFQGHMFGVIAIRLWRKTLGLFSSTGDGFQRFCARATPCIGLVRAFEFCKMQRCRWNQFVLPNLANSAAGQTRVGLWSYSMNKAEELFRKTLQELRMLSSVTINCQVAKIVMNPGCQLSVL